MSFLGSLIGGATSLIGGLFQNASAKSAASKQMAFQEKTLRHQYQWGMEDMRKAGLNPILAYKQGGAGSASGSSYTPQNVGSAAVQGASTAAASAMAMKAQEEQLKNIAADTKLKEDQSATQTALQLQHRMAAAQSAAQTAKTTQETDILGLNVASAKALAAQALIDEAFYKSDAGKWLRLWEKGAGAALGPMPGLGVILGKGLGSAKGSPSKGRSGPVQSNSSSHKKNSRRGYGAYKETYRND